MPDFPSFVALDFETADEQRDSACAIGLVRMENGRATARVSRLIRPPRQRFMFTALHGITWEAVKDQPRFVEVWADVKGLLAGVHFLAAHNAVFDSAVLRVCCQGAGIARPALPFMCTVKVARQVWGIRPTRLPRVCQVLGIPLAHHNPMSDAEACAEILLRAWPWLRARCLSEK